MWGCGEMQHRGLRISKWYQVFWGELGGGGGLGLWVG